MTGITTYTNQLYGDGMVLSGQAAYGGLPVAQLTAGASFGTGASTVVMAQAVPSWVVAGMNVYDVTKAANLGTVSGSTGTTLTLSANFASAASGAADVFQFGFTPSDLSVGAGDGADIRGLVQLIRLHAAEIKAIATYLDTDIITSGQDSAANTILAAIVTAAS